MKVNIIGFHLPFLSDPGVSGPIYGSGCLSLREGCQKNPEKIVVFCQTGGGSARVNKNQTSSLQMCFFFQEDVPKWDTFCRLNWCDSCDEDTNSIRSNNDNRTIQDNMWQCLWQNQVTKHKTSASGLMANIETNANCLAFPIALLYCLNKPGSLWRHLVAKFATN